MYRPETIAQCIRLLCGHYCNGLLMTADSDMIPLSDYWHSNSNEITCYGYDLTDRTQIPMCYVAMDASKWRELFPEKTIVELLDKYPCAKSNKWEDYWGTDQIILTERIMKHRWTSIERGRTGDYAKGRIDRGNWEHTFSYPEPKIDAHMPHPFNLEQTERVMKLI